MVDKGLTKQEEMQMITPMANELSFVFSKIRQEMVKRIKDSTDPQQALRAVEVLEENI